MTNQFTRAVNTGNKYGEALVAPLTQSIVPVIDKSTNGIVGFYIIAATEFTTSPSQLILPGFTEFPLEVISVTPPVNVNLQHNGYGVPQYMAVVYTYEEARLKPWVGYSSFIPCEDSGYFSSVSMTSNEGTKFRFNRGVLFNALLVNLDQEVPVPNTPTPPDVENAAIAWLANIPYSLDTTGCRFFDFNWINLFNAKMQARKDVHAYEPLRLELVSNPTGGEYKATLVTSKGQTVLANGVMFDTIRVVQVKNLNQDDLPKDFVFTFRVIDTGNRSTNVTLTLTVN